MKAEFFKKCRRFIPERYSFIINILSQLLNFNMLSFIVKALDGETLDLSIRLQSRYEITARAVFRLLFITL